jgi:hypothetical protein
LRLHRLLLFSIRAVGKSCKDDRRAVILERIEARQTLLQCLRPLPVAAAGGRPEIPLSSAL